MEDIPEFPGPLLGNVQIQILVKSVDPADEVDDLIPLGGVGRVEDPNGDRGGAFEEIFLGPPTIVKIVRVSAAFWLSNFPASQIRAESRGTLVTGSTGTSPVTGSR